ncbi:MULTISPECIES: hypothetical protein [unclassified Streptomyces]|uniref:hypothetical protein n=1 Tax=unclassified Streptomyces TaxID=2593676 RepID=UPI0024E0BBF5|nr:MULTISPECIES: hypothetical protein [unclassified Streptomyces]WSC22288.1 hypothetical protein OIE60_22830 [Streptomyces sp. NBC_01766]WSV56136.1 hypothetical protein OG282_21925 [Streptomyces sp. NBC_01014]
MQTTTEKRSSTVRRGAAGLAFAAAVAALVAGAASAPAVAADAPPAPSYDFSDCPDIPAGVDAASWKCEVLTATGPLTLGSRSIPELAPMTITHAEGPMPDGSAGQVWGAMRSAPAAVPGGLLGNTADRNATDRNAADHNPLSALSLQPEYGGRSDFYPAGDTMGLFTMRFRVVSPLLPHGCVIGADKPVELHLKRDGDSEWVSKNPPVIKFVAYDDAFTAPAAEGCGPLGKLVNDRFGLPAAAGNAITLNAQYTFKTYDQLPPRA